MVVVLYLAPVVMFLGLARYLVAAAPKGQEIGRLMFAVGLLATLLMFGWPLAAHAIR